MIEKIKLKHLDTIISDEIDYANLMVEILGYKNSLFNKVKNFAKSFREIHDLVTELNSIDHTKVLADPKCIIKKPNKINHICYLAMLELQGLVKKDNEMEMSDYIATVISTVCYEDNRSSPYRSTSKSFKNLKTQILNQPLLDMVGLYNWILKEIKESDKLWSQRFFAVEVLDEDLKNAGQDMMSQFNVVNTITSICEDFNVSEKEAWLVSYDLVQMNSLGKATQYKIQDNLRIIKEAKIEANKKLKR